MIKLLLYKKEFRFKINWTICQKYHKLGVEIGKITGRPRGFIENLVYVE